MALFDQMKDIFSSVKEKSAEVAAVAADKTKDAARIAKLTVDLGAEKDNLKKAYLELGKAYYEEHKDDADGLFAQLCEEIAVVSARVDAMQAELDGLKGSFRPAPEPDFESVVSEQEADIAPANAPESVCESCEAPTCDSCDAAKGSATDATEESQDKE